MRQGAVTVLGLGFAGSLAAYRLAEAGLRVTIIDPHAKKRLNQPGVDGADPRSTPGVAQSGHLHVLLARGLGILAGIYPDLPEFLDDSRCPTLDWAADTVWSTPFGRAPVYDSGIRTRSVSRTHLDAFMLRKAATHPGITIRAGAAKNLAFAAGRVCGIALESGAIHSASLVVDARGSGSTILADLGLGSAAGIERRTRAGICYRTVLLSDAQSDRQHYEQPHPLGQRDGAVLTQIERGQAVLTTIHYPGSSLVRRPLQETLATLKDGAFLAALHAAGSVSRPRRFVFGDCIWRRFGQLPQWPEGLAVMGDAAYRLNPVFGQGMTVTARCVEALLRQLAQSGAFTGYQKAADRIVAVPWHLSSHAVGSVMGRIVDCAVRRAFSSRRVHRRFLLAQHMLGFPTSGGIGR